MTNITKSILQIQLRTLYINENSELKSDEFQEMQHNQIHKKILKKLLSHHNQYICILNNVHKTDRIYNTQTYYKILNKSNNIQK